MRFLLLNRKHDEGGAQDDRIKYYETAAGLPFCASFPHRGRCVNAERTPRLPYGTVGSRSMRKEKSMKIKNKCCMEIDSWERDV